MAAKPGVDWEAIQRDYRAGQLSIREIGRAYKVDPKAIRKHAEAGGWQRDLTERIRAGVRAKSSESTVKSSESSRVDLTEDQVIAGAVDRGVRAVGGHLARAARLQELHDHMMDMVEAYLAGDDEAARIFAGKSDGVANLSRACGDLLERAVKLERLSLNLDDDADKDKSRRTVLQMVLPHGP